MGDTKGYTFSNGSSYDWFLETICGKCICNKWREDEEFGFTYPRCNILKAFELERFDAASPRSLAYARRMTDKGTTCKRFTTEKRYRKRKPTADRISERMDL